MPTNKFRCSGKPGAFHHWLSDGPIALPDGQRDAKRRWQMTLLFLDADNVVHPFAVTPDRRLRLSQALDLLMAQLTTLNDDLAFEPIDVGFEIR